MNENERADLAKTVQEAMADELAKPAPKVPEFRDARGDRIPQGSKVLWAVGGQGYSGHGAGVRWGVVEGFVTKPGGGRPSVKVKPVKGSGGKSMVVPCGRVIVDYQDHYARVAAGMDELSKYMVGLKRAQMAMATEVRVVGDDLREALLDEDGNLEDLVEVVRSAVDRLIPKDPAEAEDQAVKDVDAAVFGEATP